jgi:hypothetical protein
MEPPNKIITIRKWNDDLKSFRGNIEGEEVQMTEQVLTTYGDIIKDTTQSLQSNLNKYDANYSNLCLITTQKQESSVINFDNSLAPLTRSKKPKYSQINNSVKSIKNPIINSSPEKESTSDNSGIPKGKRRVKFKSEFLDFVDVESFKAYNIKMCFSEISGFYTDTKSDSWCKECMNAVSKCTIF